MIEQVIYFALGCIVTALASLAFMPLLWRRALRLTRARLQLQVPLSMQEILAERDQLRAEFAIERLKLEQTMEKVRAGKTRDMALIGRQSVVATQMAGKIAALNELEQSQEREIRRLLDELGSASSEAGALRVEVHDAHGLVERWRARTDRDAAARSAMRNELDTKRTLVGALETRVAGFETRLADAAHANELREGALRGRLEAAMAQSARHETSGLSYRRDLDEARLRIRALEEELAAAGANARERETNASLERSLQIGRVRGLDRTHARNVESLAAENEAIREELASLRGRAPEPRGGDASQSSEDDGGLRSSIHALGLAVARMTRTSDGAQAPGERERRTEAASPVDAL